MSRDSKSSPPLHQHRKNHPKSTPFSIIPTQATLFRLQALSGLSFASFTLAHLLNHALLLLPGFGVEDHSNVMNELRQGYQNPIVELTILGSVLVHAGASIMSLLKRIQYIGLKHAIRDVLRPSQPLSLHRISGYMLMAFVCGHVAATRLFPLQSGYDIDVTYGTLSIEVLPWMFGPYYIAFCTAGIYHSLFGISQTINRLTSFSVPQSRSFWQKIFALSLVGGSLITWAVAGQEVVRREEFLAIYESYMPQFMQVWKQ